LLNTEPYSDLAASKTRKNIVKISSRSRTRRRRRRTEEEEEEGKEEEE